MPTDVSLFTRSRGAAGTHGVVVLLIALLMLGSTGISGADTTAATDNLLSPNQHNMAGGIDGWVAGDDVSITHSNVLGFVSDSSLQVNVAARQASAEADASVRTTPVSATAAHIYEATVRTRPATRTSAVRCELEWLDTNGDPLATTPGEARMQQAGQWTQHSCSGTAPKGSVSVALAVVVEDAADHDVHHIDDAWLIDQGPEAVDDPVYQNLLSSNQHSFASSSEGWTPQGNTTIQRTSGASLIGAHALAITVDASGPWPDNTRTARAGTDHTRNGAVPVEEGHEYLASWHILAKDKASPVRCELRFMDSNGRILINDASADFSQSLTEVWTEVECRSFAPSNAALASVRVFIDEADYGDVYYVDDAWLVDLSTVGEASPPDPDPTPDPTPDPDPDPTPDPDPDPTPDPDPDLPAGREEIIAAAGLSDPSKVPSHSEGTIRVRDNGAVVENRHASYIVIEADDVTLRNVRVTSGALYGVRNTAGHRNLTVENSELVCTSNPDVTSTCLISWGPHTVRNSYIAAFGADAVKTSGGATYEGNYIVATKPDGSAHHTDGVQTRAGNNLSFVRNVIDAPALQGGNSALIIQAAAGNIRGVTISDNYLSGGNYTVYTTQKAPYSITDVRITNNVFAPHHSVHPLGYRYGTILNHHSGAVIQGNTFIDGSSAP